MRISTASFFAASLTGIQSQQSSIARLNQQIASNQKYLAAKDNPVATSQIMSLTSSLAMREQYLANIQKADVVLKHEETVLEGLYTALSRAKTSLNQTSNSQDQGLRDQMAKDLANLYLHIKDLGNTRDSAGNYIFAGFQTDTLPFDHTPSYPTNADSPDTVYAGDDGTRSIEINQGQRVQVSDTLTDVFQTGMDPDLLEAIDQAAVDLADQTVSQPTLATSLESFAAVVDTALSQLKVTLNSVAGRMTILNDVKETHQSLKLADQNALGDLKDLDQAAAIVELQQRQVSLQAAMQAFSNTSNLSLFNYL
jgi:flagellar hook-associated protein 3 FlgL